MEELRVDAYSPPEIAKRIAAVAEKKSGLDFFRMFVLAILAGVFIAFGAEFYTLVVHDSGLAFGLNSLIGGLVFCLGLILVVVAGAELFTGNSLVVMGFIEGKVSARQLLKGWGIVYLGNFAGSLVMVLLVYYTAQWGFHDAMVGGKALLIANTKVNMTFLEAFMRGILCNVLVCLAIWLAFSGRTTIDKILAVIFPITAFVASGFEHCVANMYFIPMGMALAGQSDVLVAAQGMVGQPITLGNLTIAGFLVKNLIPVTLGNIIGGSLLVGVIYWSVYLRQFSFRSLFRIAQVGFQLIFLVHPRELSPGRIAANLSSFYGLLRRRPIRRRPLPRDLTTIIEEETEEED
ncbi:MAG: formate/nitrite transporter family protein [Dehalococcoidia bacterium]|nr:MAG: formate/nitrite transporter family protein [Dehalococcoidia bacterium]